MATQGPKVYRGCTPVVDRQYRAEHESAAAAIVEAVSAAADVDPAELPPLYEFVDPDAIDTLFDHGHRAEAPPTLLGFQVESWNVFVRSDGRIRVCDARIPTDPEPVFSSVRQN